MLTHFWHYISKATHKSPYKVVIFQKERLIFQFSIIIIMVYALGASISIFNGFFWQALPGLTTCAIALFLPYAYKKNRHAWVLIFISFFASLTIYVDNIFETEQAHNEVFYVMLFFGIPFFLDKEIKRVYFFTCMLFPLAFFILSINNIRLFESPYILTEEQINMSKFLNYILVLAVVLIFATILKNNIRKLTHALEKENETLAQIFHNTSDAIILCDVINARIFDCNPKALDMFEADNKSQFIGLEATILEKDQVSNNELSAILLQITKCGFYKRVALMVTLKGKEFWGDISVNYINKNNKSFILVRISDITLHIQNIHKLEKSEAYLQALINKPHIFIWSIDKEMLLLDFNNAFFKSIEKVYKFTPKKGASVLGFLEPVHRAFWVENYKKSLNGEQFTSCWKFKGRTYEVDFTPLLLQDEIFGVSLLAQDVTSKKLLEKELIQTREKALEASKAKEIFLSNISHDIRTPLNSMLGITQLLISNQPTVKQKEHLQILQFSIKNLFDLVNDVLDIQKIDSDNLSLVYEELNLSFFLKNTAELHSFTAKQKKIDLNLEIGEGIPQSLLTDSLRLTQIFNNLINNAIKFTHKGHILIQAKVTQTNEYVTYIRFSVSDTGIGIPEDKLDTIFTPYKQADTTIERRFGGTGLGLAITQKLVYILGGNIHVKSTLGKGTTFEFTLPFDHRKEAQVFLPPQDAPFNHYVLAGKKVLIVDDSPFNTYVAKQFLEAWDMVVEVADNGKLAVDKVKESYFDAILMDLQMPGMDGFEATEHIRAFNTTVKIIALTAFSEDSVKEKIFQTGMNDFLLKPFIPDDFKAKLCTVLSESNNLMV